MTLLEEVVKDLKQRIEEAKKSIEAADKLVKFGEEAGIDVSEQKVKLASVKSDLERIERAFKKHFG